MAWRQAITWPNVTMVRRPPSASDHSGSTHHRPCRPHPHLSYLHDFQGSGCADFIDPVMTMVPDMTTPMNPVVSSCLTSPGNNVNGAPCIFPFIYNGQSQSTCIPEGRNFPWCSLTDNYDDSGLWGYCTGEWTDGHIYNICDECTIAA